MNFAAIPSHILTQITSLLEYKELAKLCIVLRAAFRDSWIAMVRKMGYLGPGLDDLSAADLILTCRRLPRDRRSCGGVSRLYGTASAVTGTVRVASGPLLPE